MEDGMYHSTCVFRSLHNYTDTKWVARWEKERKLARPIDWTKLSCSRTVYPTAGIIAKVDDMEWIEHRINGFGKLCPVSKFDCVFGPGTVINTICN
jgi:hypothetical protein